MVDLGSDFLDTEEHNGVAFTRLSSMPYVATVQTLDDFSLWQDRKELGLRGLISTYPMPEDERKQAAKSLVQSIYDHEKGG